MTARAFLPWRTGLDMQRSTNEPRPAAGKSRLAAVDGLRAFAALWVVLFHMRALSGAHLPPVVDLFVRSGSTGVSLFLVLSGFCLYVPLAGDRADGFDARRFFGRRCRRLLPTYYVTLAVLLALDVVAAGHLGFGRAGSASLAVQGATHLTLTQQFFSSTFYGVNGSYWSLGLEWELYLTFPLLVAAARRFGVARTATWVIAVNALYRIALALAIGAGALASGGVLSTDVLPNLFLGRWGEFALGMLAADLYRRGVLQQYLRPLVVLLPLAAAAALLLTKTPVAHLLFGATFFALLCIVLSGRTLLARIFSWPPLVAVGAMSFSLYLVHQPILQIEAALLAQGQGTSVLFAEMLALLPVVLACAALLFVLVERRSFSTKALKEIPGWVFFEQHAPMLRRSVLERR